MQFYLSMLRVCRIQGWRPMLLSRSRASICFKLSSGRQRFVDFSEHQQIVRLSTESLCRFFRSNKTPKILEGQLNQSLSVGARWSLKECDDGPTLVLSYFVPIEKFEPDFVTSVILSMLDEVERLDSGFLLIQEGAGSKRSELLDVFLKGVVKRFGEAFAAVILSSLTN